MLVNTDIGARLKTSTEPHAIGFPPIAQSNAKLLILGSLPGQDSLRQQQYYAHPRNAFWRVIEAVFGIPACLPYIQRCQALTDAGVALWDVCASAHRPGSLDGAIKPDSVVANDLADFLLQHPQIQQVYFNGATAAALFRKHIQPHIEIATFQLPSTSPAHATLAFEEKVQRWSAIKQALR